MLFRHSLSNPKFTERIVCHSTSFYGTLPRFARQFRRTERHDAPSRALGDTSPRSVIFGLRQVPETSRSRWPHAANKADAFADNKADAFADNQPFRPFGLPTWQAFRPNRHLSRTRRQANQSPRHFCRKCVRKRWALPRNRLSIRYMRIGLCPFWDIDQKPTH